MLKNINLQLFAEDTNPDEKKDTDSKTDIKKDENMGFSIRRAFGLKEKEPEKKEPEKKEDPKPAEDKKPEDKQPESLKEPETKEPEKPEETKEEEFITIKHLGKEVKIPAAEKQKYLQMGYDYSHVKEESEKSKSTLLRIAKIEGFNTVDEYLAELDKKEKTKLAEKIEEAAGDPDKIDEIVKNHPEVVKTREDRRKLDEEKRSMDFEKFRDELKKDQFFKELEPKFDELVEQNPTLDPRLLYKIVRNDYLTPEKIGELITKEKESAVKATIADQHDKERRAAPTGGDAADNKEEVARPSAFASKISSVFGVSAAKVAQRSQERLKQRS